MTTNPLPLPLDALLSPAEAAMLRARGELLPRCPHGLDHVARDDGTPRCPCCRRGIPADAPEPPPDAVPPPVQRPVAPVKVRRAPRARGKPRKPASEPDSPPLATVLPFRPRGDHR